MEKSQRREETREEITFSVNAAWKGKITARILHVAYKPSSKLQSILSACWWPIAGNLDEKCKADSRSTSIQPALVPLFSLGESQLFSLPTVQTFSASFFSLLLRKTNLKKIQGKTKDRCIFFLGLKISVPSKTFKYQTHFWSLTIRNQINDTFFGVECL